MRKRWCSLHTQFILLSLLLVIAISCIWFLQYSTMADILRKQAHARIDGLIGEIADAIIQKSESIESMANTIVKNQYMQPILTEDKPYYNFNNVRSFVGTVFAFTEEGDDAGHIVVLNNHNQFLYINQLNSRYYIVDQLDKQYDLFSKEAFPSCYSGPVSDPGDKTTYFAYMQPIFDTSYAAKPLNKLGTLLIFNTTESIKRSIDNFSLPDGYKFFVLSADNKVIASNNPDDDVEPMKDDILSALSYVGNQENASLIKNVRGIDSLIQYRSIPEVGWKMLSVVPIAEINSDLGQINRYYLLFLALLVGIILLWYGSMFVSFVRPLKQIVKFSAMGAHHNLSSRLKIRSHNEVGELATHINEMFDEIDDLLRQTIQDRTHMYEMELVKKRAELSALHSQINPHFLYNTLDSIKGFGYLCNNTEIVEITTSLSYIMRYCIKGSEFVPVSDELTCMQKYLKIIAIRFPDRFRVDINIDKEIMCCKIPRFILQPILENAIYHGLEPVLNGGTLTVTGKAAGHDLITFTIQDNGVGISKEILAQLHETLSSSNALRTLDPYQDRSIGLINLHNRLQTVYGPGYGLTIDSEEGVGTTIKVHIPIHGVGAKARKAAGG